MIKSILFIFCLILTTTANAKHIDITVSDSDGCNWRIVGEVEYSLFPPNIESYDLTVTNCHGDKWQFHGNASPTSNPPNDSLEEYTYSVELIEGSYSEEDLLYVYTTLYNYIAM